MNDLLFILGIFFIILFLLGVIMYTIGYVRMRPQKRWLETIGVIVKKTKAPEIVKRFIKDLDQQPDYYPTVRFSVNEVDYESTSKIHQSPGLPPGKEVSVLYDPENPERAVINTRLQNGAAFKIAGIILLSLSLIIAIVGMVVYFY